MRNVVTVSQRYPTWAAAYAARERLAEDGGFDGHGIERIDIERWAGRFELLVRTDEFHRDEIEHLLRSAGTAFNGSNTACCAMACCATAGNAHPASSIAPIAPIAPPHVVPRIAIPLCCRAAKPAWGK